MFADNHPTTLTWPSGCRSRRPPDRVDRQRATNVLPTTLRRVRGWVGIELPISDEDLRFHIEVAWELIARKRCWQRGDPGNAGRSDARHCGTYDVLQNGRIFANMLTRCHELEIAYYSDEVQEMIDTGSVGISCLSCARSPRRMRGLGPT